MSDKQKIIVFILAFIVLANLGAFILLKGAFHPEQVPEEQAKAKIAVVIDDWGYNLNCVKLLRQIGVPVTVSILPNLTYSARIAELARSLDQQVILHLPLEPDAAGRDYIGLEKDTITTDMQRERIIDILEHDLESIPYVRGVSNHMGSAATRDPRLMSLIFEQLKKRDLFFLDNLVTEDSVCRVVAGEKHLVCLARDVFLDNQEDAEYIRGQFEQLRQAALARGKAIGIGHAKTTTLEVLKEEVSRMREAGIKFVFVSELVE